MIVTTTLVLALLPFAAGLEDDIRFRDARGMYDGMNLEGALGRFELVLLDDSLSDEERARLLMWIGLTEAELGRLEKAGVRFEDAIVLDPNAALPAETSPKVKDMVRQARERASEREPEPEELEPAPAPDVKKDDDGTVRPRAAGVLIPSSGRARDAYGIEVDPESLREPPAASGWLLASGGVAAAVGVVAVVAGGGVAVVALADYDAASAETDDKRESDLQARADLEAVAATVVLIVGGALALAGIGLLTAGLLVE